MESLNFINLLKSTLLPVIDHMGHMLPIYGHQRYQPQQLVGTVNSGPSLCQSGNVPIQMVPSLHLVWVMVQSPNHHTFKISF